VIRSGVATRLFAAAVSEFAKNVHGRSAAYAKSGYGTPSEGMPAKRPKKRLKTTIVMNGWMIAQDAPKAVCLYRTLMSRQARK
jgi:hypothetical protein